MSNSKETESKSFPSLLPLRRGTIKKNSFKKTRPCFTIAQDNYYLRLRITGPMLYIDFVKTTRSVSNKLAKNSLFPTFLGYVQWAKKFLFYLADL